MRNLALLALVPLLAIACGEKGPAYECPGATPPASWDDWKLPLDRGKVCKATEKRIEIMFTAGDQKTLFERFADAVEAQGWLPEANPSGAPECEAERCGVPFSNGDQHGGVSAVKMSTFAGQPIVVAVER